MWERLIPSFSFLAVVAICALPVMVFIYRRLVRARLAAAFSTASKRATDTLYPYGACEHIGRRPYMEDRCLVVGRLKGDRNSSLYAVFDGHGGPRAAEHCVSRMQTNLVEDPSFPADPVRALKNAFIQTDAEFLETARSSHPPLDDGTTAVVAYVNGDQIWVANAGDSRALLVQQSGHHVLMSEDHKPNRPDETARIKRAGGTVYFHGVWRVGGVLAVSRAIGDRTLKPYVTALPEIKHWQVTPADTFLVLASDGLWDVISNEEVGYIIADYTDPEAAAQQLVRVALSRASADNVTCVVVDLQRPKYRQFAAEEARASTQPDSVAKVD